MVGCSTDSVYSHKAWVEHELGPVPFPLIGDTNHQLSLAFDVLKEDLGVALRGTFIIDPSGAIVSAHINDLNVGRSVEETLRTLHAWGGKEMMAAAASAAREESAKTGKGRPILLGVTVLTSLKDDELHRIGFAHAVADQVLRLAVLAKDAGLDGVVCSPHEIEIIKKECGRDFLIVTPGIRPGWAAGPGQKRRMTPPPAP